MRPGPVRVSILSRTDDSSPKPSTVASLTPTASASALAAAKLPDDATSYAKMPRLDPLPGPPPAEGFAAAAASCPADASCPMDRHARLLLTAADRREAGVGCFQLLRGVGVAADMPRARACFAAAVEAEGKCTGSSPSLERLQLAV